MRVVAFEDDGVATVTGRLVGATARELEARLAVLLSDGSGELTLDLTEVQAIDSEGLAALVDAHQRALRQGGELRIVPPPGSACRIFHRTRTDHFFHFVAAPASSTAALAIGA
jgi:anti-anti-sigma factor